MCTTCVSTKKLFTLLTEWIRGFVFLYDEWYTNDVPQITGVMCLAALYMNMGVRSRQILPLCLDGRNHKAEHNTVGSIVTHSSYQLNKNQLHKFIPHKMELRTLNLHNGSLLLLLLEFHFLGWGSRLEQIIQRGRSNLTIEVCYNLSSGSRNLIS